MGRAGWMKRLWRELLLAFAAISVAMTAVAGGRAEEATRGAELITKHKTDWGEVGKRLKRDHSFALVIGISEFDNGGRLTGVADEVLAVSDAFAKQGFAVTAPVADGRMTKVQL